MKKLIYCLVFLLPLASCVSKKDADKLKTENTTLSAELAEKDSMINEVFASLGVIAENLNEIKTREKLISSSVNAGEVPSSASVQISDDIRAIDELLKKNRETIARLQKSANQLKAANVKIETLDNLIKEMSLQVEAKDAEIMELKAELERLNTQVTTLTTTIDGLSTERAQLQNEIKAKTDLLHSAYYIVGSEKELINKEIIYKSGFIGRTIKINETRNLDSFTQVDTRYFDEVIIGRKNITMVSMHPEDSYQVVMDQGNLITSVVITDKDKFWEYSKVLIISYK